MPVAARLGRGALRPWLEGAVLFAVRAVAVLAVAGFAARGLGPLSTFGIALRPGDRGLVAAFFHWDSVRYLSIAAHGYTNRSLTVYFPLYPMVVRAVHLLGLSYAHAALVVSWTVAFLLTVAVIVLVRECLGVSRWLSVVLLVLWAPASFFYFSGYPEGMEVLALTLVLIWVRRGRFVAAAVAAGVASASAPFGLLFVVPVLVGIVQDRMAAGPAQPARRLWGRLAAAVVLGELGAIAYISFLWARFGAPFEFETAQAQWNRQVTWPFHGLFWSVGRMLHGQLIGTPAFNGNFVVTDAIDDAVTVAVVVALVALCVHIARRGQWRSPLLPGVVLSGVWTIFNVCNATAGGVSPEALARHLGVLVPVYLAVALLRRAEVSSGIFALSVVLGTVAQTLFSHNLWFT